MTAMTAPWRVTIGRLSIEWMVAAQLAEGAHALLEARPRRSAARGTPPTPGAAWRARVEVWMREIGG